MKVPWLRNIFKPLVDADQPDPAGGKSLPRTARLAVADHFRGTRQEPCTEPEGYLAQRRGIFVTIWTRDGRLRGCRGTIQPMHQNLVAETRAVALSSALQDERFEPVSDEELERLIFEVSVLHPPEPVVSQDQLDPFVYGIIVRATDGRQALMLPGVEGLDTADRQLDATRRKGQIHPDEPVEILRFRVDKFREP